MSRPGTNRYDPVRSARSRARRLSTVAAQALLDKMEDPQALCECLICKEHAVPAIKEIFLKSRDRCECSLSRCSLLVVGYNDEF